MSISEPQEISMRYSKHLFFYMNINLQFKINEQKKKKYIHQPSKHLRIPRTKLKLKLSIKIKESPAKRRETNPGLPRHRTQNSVL